MPFIWTIFGGLSYCGSGFKLEFILDKVVMEELSLIGDSQAQDALFKAQAQKLSFILASEGVYVRTFAPGLPHFSQLSVERKCLANKNLGFYIELCREHMSEGYSLKDGASFLWRAFHKLKLIPRSDLFNYFHEDSVIEIYSIDNVQLFRNLNFFKYCSYTLEELHSQEWWLLFERNAQILGMVHEYAMKFVTGELTENVGLNIPRHTVRELASAELLETEVDFVMAGPLMHQRKTAGFIVTENVRIINSKSMANN